MFNQYGSSVELVVSILARPVGRALPRIDSEADAARLFQSSPAPWDGRYVFNQYGSSVELVVSILARPVGRALHDRPDSAHRYH